MNNFKPLSALDLDALNAMARAGLRGLTRDDIHTALGNPSNKHAAHGLIERARARGHRIQALHVGMSGNAHVYRYVLLAEGESIGSPALYAEYGIRSVPRRVAPDPSWPSSVGAVVSVAYVSCLDAATGGEA